MPHFPDATKLPMSGALAKRLGDRIKMVEEAEMEDDLAIAFTILVFVDRADVFGIKSCDLLH